ncbi:MAG: hypothetical protein PHP99_12215 [Paludibacter sp.]|nr:hypothetical protein [Paludibacter sp.]MDD3489533.1 hypothetical protein [Paludibacter sp.]
MKKVILSFFLIAFAFVSVKAQVDGRAIGLRFSGILDNNAEISYQHPLSQINRLEVDLGLNHDMIALTGVYQWVWDFSQLADGFNLYAGVGGLVGVDNSRMGLSFVGQGGIEYTFNIPLQLSLDYRPAVSIISGINNNFANLCLSARFKF